MLVVMPLLVAALAAGEAPPVASSVPETIAEACTSRLAAAGTASGRITYATSFIGPLELEFKLMKPNLYMLVADTFEERFDGKIMWRYSVRRKTYQKLPLERFEPPAILRGLAAFFKDGGPPYEIRTYEMGRFGDRPAAVAVGRTSGGAEIRIFADAESGLPLGWIQEDGKDVTKASISELRLDPPLDSAAFAWRPPEEAREARPPDFDATMLQVGARAPQFHVERLDGTSLGLADALKGRKGLLLVFWFISCVPCRLELPRLQEMYPTLESQGLALLGVNNGDSADAIRAYAASEGLSLPMARNGAGPDDAAAACGVGGYPTTYLLDAGGVVRWRTIGYDEEELRAALRAFGLDLDGR